MPNLSTILCNSSLEKFEIKDIPAGTYEIEAWHEKLGTQTASVTLAEGETKEVNFTFQKPSK